MKSRSTTLVLLSYNERDALEMEALEVLLLGALGYPNPY